jgi:hypothetical protein
VNPKEEREPRKENTDEQKESFENCITFAFPGH